MIFDLMEELLKNEAIFEDDNLRKRVEEYYALKEDVDLRVKNIDKLKDLRWEMFDKKNNKTEKKFGNFLKRIPIFLICTFLMSLFGNLEILGIIMMLMYTGYFVCDMYTTENVYRKEVAKIEVDLEEQIREYVNKNEYLYKFAELLSFDCRKVKPYNYRYEILIPFDYNDEMRLVSEIRESREKDKKREENIEKVKKRIRIKGNK